MYKAKIYAAKQRGEISHFTSDLKTLLAILKSGVLRPGESPEFDINTDYYRKYVAFGRDLLAAPTRRNNKWQFGLLINGDQLSENYNIFPYNYETADVERKYNIEAITYFSNNTFTVKFCGLKAVQISFADYEYFKDYILDYKRNHDAGFEHKVVDPKNLQNERKVNGLYVYEKLWYTKPHGGPKVPYSKLPIALNAWKNEYEERFWGEPALPNKKKLNKKAKNTTDPITNYKKPKEIVLTSKILNGIILPRDYQQMFENGEDEILVEIKSYLDKICGRGKWRVMYY